MKREIQIESKYSKVQKVRELLDDICKSLKVDDTHCAEVKMCLTEALNNVIKHAYGSSEEEVVDVIFSVDGFDMAIEIVDYGKPADKLQPNELNYDPSDIQNLPESGMGLFIINKIMDSMNYESRDGSNIFSMNVRLKIVKD